MELFFFFFFSLLISLIILIKHNWTSWLRELVLEWGRVWSEGWGEKWSASGETVSTSSTTSSRGGAQQQLVPFCAAAGQSTAGNPRSRLPLDWFMNVWCSQLDWTWAIMGLSCNTTLCKFKYSLMQMCTMHFKTRFLLYHVVTSHTSDAFLTVLLVCCYSFYGVFVFHCMSTNCPSVYLSSCVFVFG